MKIVIIADSLLMFRPDEGTNYEHTYGYLLKRELQKTGMTCILCPKRKNDTAIQSEPDNLLYDITAHDPDIVCVQLGIVDCAPRLFTQKQYEIVRHLPAFIRKAAIFILRRNRKLVTRLFPKEYVKQDDFKKNLQKILDTIKKCEATPVLINIAKPA
ncbi:MAG: hypothetical protein ABIF92_00840, partial [archaeon]